jgi:toxin ParE1/3/4
MDQMKVHWLKAAAHSLDQEYAYLSERNPEVAKRVFKRIVASTERLGQFPDSGRQGQVSGTRELIVPGIPYLIVYRVTDQGVEILRVFHESRNWPGLMT